MAWAAGIWGFFNSYPGAHIVQAFLHSMTAAVIADRSIAAWDIRSPLLRQRFRLMVILIPVFSYPLYQLINPDRGSVHFRLGALFDSGRWLGLELWGAVPVGGLFVLLLLSTAGIFLLQELIPILRHAAESKQSEIEWDHLAEGSPVLAALDGLPGPRPEVFIAEDEGLIIHSATGNKPAVFISTGLVQALEPDELRAALAHEIAHVQRSRRPILIFTFLLRVAMFFSPAALVEFRRVVEEEEKICDDAAAKQTGEPAALAGALEKLRRGAFDAAPEGKTPGEMLGAIEHYSHDMLLRARIRRLADGAAGAEEGWRLKFAATLAAVMTINYFIV